MDISKFEYLWDGSSPEWVLLHVNILEIEEVPRYLIVNVTTREAKLIEEPQVFNAVVAQMLNSKVNIVSIGNGF